MVSNIGIYPPSSQQTEKETNPDRGEINAAKINSFISSCWMFIIFVLDCDFFHQLFYLFSFLALPETLSMKGLTLNCMDRKAEAYELVRLGLKVGILA